MRQRVEAVLGVLGLLLACVTFVAAATGWAVVAVASSALLVPCLAVLLAVDFDKPGAAT